MTNHRTGRGSVSGPGEVLACSFCGHRQDEVNTLVAGPSVFICDGCVTHCDSLLVDEFGGGGKPDISHIPTPREIHGFLDEYVIGQDDAKKVLAVAVYNHYKRVAYGNAPDGVEIGKSNILLMGPTGSGKTYLAETLARYLEVPFAMVDATSLTEAGYVGEDVESAVEKLLQSCDYDVERARHGIIYIDEIDKLTSRSMNPTHGRDVSGEGVQQALLKMIEGRTVPVTVKGGSRYQQAEQVQFDTREVLFICGGAFAGLTDVVAHRTAPQSMGFTAGIGGQLSADQLRANVEPMDLVSYGLIPEFIGRLPVLASLDALDEQALLRILTEPRNALVKQYTALFDHDDCELEFTREALAAIAREALARGTGARGLRGLMERTLLDPMFEVPARLGEICKVVVNKAAATGRGLPIYREAVEERQAIG